MLLTAYHHKKISLENIVRLTRVNLYDIFKLSRKDENFVLVDLTKEQKVQRVNQTRTDDIVLKGWPEYILLKGNLFRSPEGGHHLIRVDSSNLGRSVSA